MSEETLNETKTEETTETSAPEPAVVEEPKAAKAKVVTAESTSNRGYRKVREGIVVSTTMDKTVVVNVERLVRHKRYGKVIARGKKIKAHDEKGECAVGDLVRIMETRPLSKTKNWRYIETIRKAVVV